MRVGILGTGAIADKHAQAYRNIGFELAACGNRSAERGKAFAERWGTQYVGDWKALCSYPGLDFVDMCTFPDFRLEPVELCASLKRHVQVQKPMAISLETARRMIDMAAAAGIQLGVVSQHRFDDATLFLKRALAAGRLGKLLQADAYVKWYRSDAYYARPGKGAWNVEGGGALINQAIHQIDLLLHLAGPVKTIGAMWQLGARHKIESEDVINALLRYESGATGVVQAATAFWPGYTERVELSGTKGTAIISGDRLASWDVEGDEEANAKDPAPVQTQTEGSGSSDPMAIGVTTFERQFTDFGESIKTGRKPMVDGQEGYAALALVLGIYDSCKQKRFIDLQSGNHNE